MLYHVSVHDAIDCRRSTATISIPALPDIAYIRPHKGKFIPIVSTVLLTVYTNTKYYTAYRLTIQHARSFRLTQSFQPLSLSHSTSNMSINFLGNTPLGRAQRLLAFVHSHKAVLNLIVRSRPNVLEGSLAALVRVTQLRSYLGFDAKRKYFFAQLRKMRPERGRRSVHLQLRRGAYVLGCCLSLLMSFLFPLYPVLFLCLVMSNPIFFVLILLQHTHTHAQAKYSRTLSINSACDQPKKWEAGCK
jgi:hypothetical protein